MAIYNGFTHKKMWISIVMLVYQRVPRVPGFWPLAIHGLAITHGHSPRIPAGWAPQDSVQLTYKWLNYGLWMFVVDIAIVNGVSKFLNQQTENWGAPSCADPLKWTQSPFEDEVPLKNESVLLDRFDS